MGYKITYGNKTEIHYYPYRKRDNKKRMKIRMLAIIGVLILLLAGTMIESESRLVANSALTNLRKEITEGGSLADAITVFCRDIIESAKTVE